MYFPLLRAKQFELLAIREIAPYISTKKVSPVIEPTKSDASQILKAINAFLDNNINFNLVLNSCVVTKNVSDCMDNISYLINNHLSKYENFQIALNIVDDESAHQLSKYLEINNLQNKSFSLIHTSRLEDLSGLQDFIRNYNVKYNFIHLEKVKNRYNRNFNRETLVTLSDSFLQKQRNADYAKTPDEFFSDDFAFYSQDGYVGFSDYLTIGEQFSDSGFTPYVVAIHLTYFKDNKLRVAHFTSNSNTDTNYVHDLPIKFNEALEALISFVNINKVLCTKAVEEFKALKLKNHYPGLGTIKKLSVMHHVELVSSLI